MRTIIISARTFPALALLALGRTVVAAEHDYVVTVDAALRELTVEARFSASPGRISARSGAASRFLVAAVDCDAAKPLRQSGRRLYPEAHLRCLRYTVDLAAAARSDRRNRTLHRDNIVVSPTVWLWRPRLAADDAINVRFVLPGELGVSVPWQSIDTAASAYRLTASPQSGNAITIFGRFDAQVVDVAGVPLRTVLLRASGPAFTAQHVEWIRATAGNITLAYGRFPNPYARVVLFPTRSWWGSAVRFGRVVRDGGETIELLVDPRGDLDEMYRSWTATHELSHLMVPYIDGDQRWISEGFAQYYQNLLLARAGLYSPQEAWQKIYVGLDRGSRSAPSLSPNEAATNRYRDTRMKLYWSGAALALMADVELRRRSNNRESLDTALGHLQRCCLPSRRIWEGTEFFAKLDEFVSEPLFVDLYDRHADTRGFPDFRPWLKSLGVVVTGSTVAFDDDAEWAEIRAVLTARRYTGKPDS